MIGKMIGETTPAEGCEGVVHVSRGKIVTQVVYTDTTKGLQGYIDAERAKPAKHTWNSVTSSSRPDANGICETRYSRNDWKAEDVCGRDEIKPRDGEYPYDPFTGSLIRVNPDGKRYAAFISGDETQIKDHQGMLAVMRLIDSTYEDE
jgi:hypothetical protein